MNDTTATTARRTTVVAVAAGDDESANRELLSAAGTGATGTTHAFPVAADENYIVVNGRYTPDALADLKDAIEKAGGTVQQVLLEEEGA